LNRFDNAPSLDDTKRLLVRELGAEQGNRCFAFLWRLCRRQTALWRWLAQAMYRRVVSRSSLMYEAAGMLVTLAARCPDVAPERLVVAAWKDTVNEARRFAAPMPDGSARFALVDDRSMVALQQRRFVPSETEAAPTLTMRTLPQQYRHLLGARADGFTWEECARLIGRVGDREGKSTRDTFRVAVRMLLAENPALVDRMGLVICPRSTVTRCKVCGGWGYTYGDGSQIGGRD
jgi:hypothetical protein